MNLGFLHLNDHRVHPNYIKKYFFSVNDVRLYNKCKKNKCNIRSGGKWYYCVFRRKFYKKIFKTKVVDHAKNLQL